MKRETKIELLKLFALPDGVVAAVTSVDRLDSVASDELVTSVVVVVVVVVGGDDVVGSVGFTRCSSQL